MRNFGSLVKKWKKIKADFKVYKESSEHEKVALAERAKDAEGQLKIVSEELTGPKRHIFQMTTTVLSLRTSNLQDNSLLKLKALYTLTKQLYARSLLTIKVFMGNKDPVKFIIDVLRRLSTIPKQIEELKKSTACKGAITALSRALAYAAELNPWEIAGGFPQLKDHG
ncbi:hypothetical protein D1007_19118 [Hordeum vulgare]|nr:hypothetical protein D1007_19118 [Hordeum vulgare]